MLAIFIALLAYLTLDKSNPKLKTALKILILVSSLSAIVEIISYKDQIKSDEEFVRISTELGGSKKIQEAQLSELKILRQETNILQAISNTQLNATFYTESLNSTIGKIRFRINFKEPLDFDRLCPLHFAFEFYTISNKKLEFREYVEDQKIIRGDGKKEKRASSYKIYTLSMQDGSGGGYSNWGDLQTKMQDMIIPISLPEDIGVVKEFHDEKFFVWLPDSILKNANFIELIVNGWAILHENISESSWEKVQMSRLATWEKFREKELKLFRNYKGGRKEHYHPGWKINLYKEIPPKYESVESRWSDF